MSGNGKNAETEQNKIVLSWYDRVAQLNLKVDNPLLAQAGARAKVEQQVESRIEAALQRTFPTGKRAVRETKEQHRGIWIHALLQDLSGPCNKIDREAFQIQYGIPPDEMDGLWRQAQALLAKPELQRFFDASYYLSAYNEMPYVNAQGELKRIDRLVEFDDEVWVLDYKSSASHDPTPYQAQMAEYCSAMQSVYADKVVRGGLINVDGTLSEM